MPEIYESCLNCKNYNLLKHMKGGIFCPDYPKRMSVLNMDIIGGYNCEKYDRVEVKEVEVQEPVPPMMNMFQQNDMNSMGFVLPLDKIPKNIKKFLRRMGIPI